MKTHVPRPLVLNSSIHVNTHKPHPISPPTSALSTPVVKKGPKPAFKAAGFDINAIDPTLIPLIAKHGDFTTAEQARISYIVNSDFKDAVSKKVDHSGAEQQVTHSQRSHEILLACLQNNIISETNSILQHILDIISNDEKKEHHLWEKILFIGDSKEKEADVDISTIISILDNDVNKVKSKLPSIQNMINSLGDALFHTTQEYKSLRLYYIAGECKLALLGDFQTSQVATNDPLILMQQVDERHNYGLFKRKVNSFKVLVEYITSSLMQAQGLQNVLESMVENIEMMIDVNIPAFKQQLLYANSYKSIKNSPAFVAQRTTLINNIKSVLENKK